MNLNITMKCLFLFLLPVRVPVHLLLIPGPFSEGFEQTKLWSSVADGSRMRLAKNAKRSHQQQRAKKTEPPTGAPLSSFRFTFILHPPSKLGLGLG